MKKKLTHNMGLKIVSLLFAVALWVVVVNINDPVVSKRFSNIPVTFVNTSAITDDGKVYEVLNNTDVINTVTITAQRSVLDGIVSGDIVAVADFVDGMQADGSVDIDLSCSRYNSKISSIKGSSNAVKLNIEEKRTLQLVLKATTSGKVAEGCLVGNVNTDQNLVRIEGPSSVVSSIIRAAVNVDVSGASSTVATYASVVLYDADGNEVSHPALTTNCDEVRVTVEILGTKEIPLEFATQGNPAVGYLETGVITSDPETVFVCGTANNLAKINVLQIPDTELNLAGESEDMTVHINLSDYLPNGINWADKSFDGNVAVTVGIEKAETKTLSLNKETLVAVNVPENFEVTVEVGNVEEERYNVSIIGLSEDISSVRESDVVGYVDMNSFMADLGLSGAEELQPGIYEVQLLFNNLGKVKVLTPVKARLVIAEQTEETE